MVKEAQKKKRHSPMLPIMGIVVAISLGVVAYFAAPLVIDLVKNLMGEARFNSRLGTFDETQLEYAFAGVIWLTLFALAMAIVALAIGEDPQAEERLVKPTQNASAKEWKRYYKKLEKLEDRRHAQAMKKKEQDERAARKKG